MMCFTKWTSAALAITILANVASADYTVANGKVKSINADNKTFILTDSVDKDHTFKLGTSLVVNRAGKESNSDLKPGDVISVCYEKGILTWSAHYILVHEGTSKNCELIRGNIKSYDAEKRELTFTNEVKSSTAYNMGKAMFRINMEDAKIADVKIGDHALIVVNTTDGKSILQSVMVDRVK